MSSTRQNEDTKRGAYFTYFYSSILSFWVLWNFKLLLNGRGGGGDRVKETTRTSVYPNAYPIYKKKSDRRLKYIKGILRATLILWLSISMFIFFYRRPTISRWLLREFSKLMIWSTVSHKTISLYSYKEVHVGQYDTDFKTFLLKYISKTLKSSSAVYGKK